MLMISSSARAGARWRPGRLAARGLWCLQNGLGVFVDDTAEAFGSLTARIDLVMMPGTASAGRLSDEQRGLVLRLGLDVRQAGKPGASR